jgi:hypothetical protein
MAGSLSVTDDALLVVGTAVTAITTCRINFTVYLVSGQVITPVNQFPVRAVAELCGRLDFQVCGVAVVAE